MDDDDDDENDENDEIDGYDNDYNTADNTVWVMTMTLIRSMCIMTLIVMKTIPVKRMKIMIFQMIMLI